MMASRIRKTCKKNICSGLKIELENDLLTFHSDTRKKMDLNHKNKQENLYQIQYQSPKFLTSTFKMLELFSISRGPREVSEVNSWQWTLTFSDDRISGLDCRSKSSVVFSVSLIKSSESWNLLLDLWYISTTVHYVPLFFFVVFEIFFFLAFSS